MPVNPTVVRLTALADATDGILGENMEKACQQLRDETKARCPVDTGHLKQSYDYDVQEESSRTVGYVGTSVEYAGYVEYGTRHMQAQPHARPALEASREDIVDELGGNVISEAKDRV